MFLFLLCKRSITIKCSPAYLYISAFSQPPTSVTTLDIVLDCSRTIQYGANLITRIMKIIWGGISKPPNFLFSSISYYILASIISLWSIFTCVHCTRIIISHLISDSDVLDSTITVLLNTFYSHINRWVEYWSFFCNSFPLFFFLMLWSEKIKHLEVLASNNLHLEPSINAQRRKKKYMNILHDQFFWIICSG